MKKTYMFIVTLALGAASSSTAAFAAGIDRSLSGAWTVNESDCASIFEKKGGAARFTKRAEMFPASILIIGNRLMSPGGICNVQSSSASGDTVNMRLNCRTQVSYQNMSVRLKITSPTEFEYQFPDAPQLNQKYRRCQM